LFSLSLLAGFSGIFQYPLLSAGMMGIQMPGCSWQRFEYKSGGFSVQCKLDFSFISTVEIVALRLSQLLNRVCFA